MLCIRAAAMPAARLETETAFDRLMAEIGACRLCAPHLPLGPRPVVRGRPSARLLVISQAPGTLAHASGLSFDDKSGDRLRQWLGLGREAFYDEARVAILPMGFCYPGRDRNGGDLPPRRECAPRWHGLLRPSFGAIRLTLLVGSYAIRHYLPEGRRLSMTEAVSGWRGYPRDLFLLPHPSWRTTLWLRENGWFEAEVLPELRGRVRAALTASV